MATFFHINNASYRLSEIVACVKNGTTLNIYLKGVNTPYQYCFGEEESALDYLAQLRTHLENS